MSFQPAEEVYNPVSMMPSIQAAAFEQYTGDMEALLESPDLDEETKDDIRSVLAAAFLQSITIENHDQVRADRQLAIQLVEADLADMANMADTAGMADMANMAATAGMADMTNVTNMSA